MKKKTAVVLLGLSASFITIPYLAKQFGLRINTTDSAPIGIWITKQYHEGGIQRGSLISICPPDVPVVRALVATRPLYRGDCNTGSVDLLKPVAALPGDSVIAKNGNVVINGLELPNTEAHSPALAYPKGKYIVKHGEIWVFSTYTQDSFDSRYFGPVPIKNIRGFASPVLVNGDTKNMNRRENND